MRRLVDGKLIDIPPEAAERLLGLTDRTS
jgi:hypothetical protein